MAYVNPDFVTENDKTNQMLAAELEELWEFLDSIWEDGAHIDDIRKGFDKWREDGMPSIIQMKK